MSVRKKIDKTAIFRRIKNTTKPRSNDVLFASRDEKGQTRKPHGQSFTIIVDGRNGAGRRETREVAAPSKLVMLGWRRLQSVSPSEAA